MPPARQILIMFFIDVVFIACWLYWANAMHTMQEDAIVVLMVVPAVILLSAMIGILMKIKNARWADAILLNVVIAFVLFIGTFKYESWKQQHDNYREFYFTYNNKVYNIVI